MKLSGYRNLVCLSDGLHWNERWWVTKIWLAKKENLCQNSKHSPYLWSLVAKSTWKSDTQKWENDTEYASHGLSN